MASTKQSSTELRRERADIAAQMRGLLDAADGKPLTEGQQKRYDELNALQQGLDETRKRFEAQEVLDADLSASLGTVAAKHDQPGARIDGRGADPGGDEVRARLLGFTPAGQTVFSRDGGDPGAELRLQHAYGEGIFSAATLTKTNSQEYKEAFRTYLRKGRDSLTQAEHRTLSEGADPSGGYLVPEDVLNRIISKEPAPTRLSGRVTVIPTNRDRITAPRVVYTADNIYTTGMRVTWTGEVPSSATVHRVTDPVFGQLSIDVHTAMMSLPVTRDFVEDSAFPIVSWITAKFSETVDLLRDNLILNGTGVGQPHGILENPGGTDEPAVTVTGSAATIIPNSLQDIVWDVPEQYEDNSAWVFNKTSTGKTIAKMVDDNGRYLWQPLELSGLVGSRRGELLGFPVALTPFAPDISAGTYPAVFGDLRGYYRVDRVGLSVEVMRELYAETNQVLILGRLRIGGDVAEPWRMRILKVAAS